MGLRRRNSKPQVFQIQKRRNRVKRRNPLKSKIFDKQLYKLKKLGLPREVEEEIKNDFNTPYNDPSHAIYIMDWWLARLSLLKFLETENDKYLTALYRFAHKYKTDFYDIALDAELQIDYYQSLRHFAQLAENNPYFRWKWPRLHEIVYEKPSSWHWRKPVIDIVVGEVRNWVQLIRAPEQEQTIKLLTGADRAVSETSATYIPKKDILTYNETYKPSDLIIFLKDMEDNIRTDRYFVPKHHDVLLSFPDGKDWVVIRSEDVYAEGQSLRDCARAENRSTILISLREPITPTHYQALLKAEVVFPSQSISDEPSIAEIKENSGIIVQLRGYANSKPNDELHKYILPLLYQPWIVYLVKPNYQGSGYFELSDLDKDTYTGLKKKKTFLARPKKFWDLYGGLRYNAAIKNKILEDIGLPVKEMLRIISSKRINQELRIKALGELRKRLINKNKYMRTELIEATKNLLFQTRTKSLIKEIIKVLNGLKIRSEIFEEFFKIRYEWLLNNETFFVEQLKSCFPGGEYYYNEKNIPLSLMPLLEKIAVESPRVIIKLFFETRITNNSAHKARILLELALQSIIDNPELLDYDLCRWYQEEPGGWGSTSHRTFAAKIPPSRLLKNQFKELIQLSADKHNDCYMDLAVSIASNMPANAPLKIFLARQLSKIIVSESRLRHKAYDQLGRLL